MVKKLFFLSYTLIVYFCNRCENFTHSTKRQTFTTLPHVLAVHFTGANPIELDFQVDLNDVCELISSF